jgi:hypothetical protein
VSDARPECVYGILVKDGRIFLADYPGGCGLPGGVFPPLADDRKGELRAHLFDQLGIVARAIWAQGAFLYQHPGERVERFSGFYTVWEWDGDVAEGLGRWLDEGALALVRIPPSVRILLLSVLATLALRTT